MDTAKPRGQRRGRYREIRRRYPHETASATRGNFTGLRVPRVPPLFELHHRGNFADHWRLLNRVMRQTTCSALGLHQSVFVRELKGSLDRIAKRGRPRTSRPQKAIFMADIVVGGG